MTSQEIEKSELAMPLSLQCYETSVRLFKKKNDQTVADPSFSIGLLKSLPSMCYMYI